MGVYTLPDLPYDYAALEPAMTGEILELHHDKHHAAYVKGANDTLEQLANLPEEAGRFLSQCSRLGGEKASTSGRGSS
ncbi:hypothetical protein GCM10023195_08650 [Actinoallomurus liliacearum]|uniref:superoxide dismutase n=1 Tax=Actinoallomurus liliacearum TaxID=1080073 RepID=A0ABP8TE78_9ACTN